MVAPGAPARTVVGDATYRALRGRWSAFAATTHPGDPAVAAADRSLLAAGGSDIFFVNAYGDHPTTGVLRRLKPTTALRLFHGT